MPVRGPATVDAQGGVSGIAIKLFEANMESLLDITGYRAVEWVAAAGIDILGYALPMTPWESGKLRESGTVTLEVGSKRFAIAHGSLHGVAEQTGRFNRLNARKIGRWLKRKPHAGAWVSFYRMADSDEGPRDIAVWTHENLNPFESRPNPPAAKQPGTGPKYLSRAFAKRKDYWLSQARVIERRVIRDVKRSGRYRPAPAGERFAVKQVKLIARRIGRFFMRKV